MEVGIDVIWAAGLVLLCFVSWVLNLISLPGNWLIVGLVALYLWLGPEDGRVSIGYALAISVFMVAVIGEIIEFIAGALGATRAGASTRTTFYSIVGSFIGALLGGLAGLPIPIFGSIIAALLFGSLGALGGAMYGEWSDGKSWKESWTVGHAAFWGRLWGTLGKFAAGGLMVGLVALGVIA